MPHTLLLIEDDVPLARLTAEYLTAEGYRVAVAHRGDAVDALIRARQPSLILLDVMMPGEDGFAICRRIREDYTGLIVMLTALDEGAEQLAGFEAGADDYLVKPVVPEVLLARLRALLRGTPRATRTVLQFGDMAIDLLAHRATLRGAALPFSSTEFELLSVFARHAGEPLGREVLLQNLRGLAYDGMNRSIDMRVSRLRRKLSELQCPITIRTIMSRGYLLSAIDDETAA